ncbi:hypothetical protein [Rhizobium leguminosarum]|uniref:hypothetical protein n=1 Tax=Rhizobium leguminosarum TaxID=384 RepID=UPI003511CFF2
MSFLVNSYRYLSAGATLTVDAGTFTLTGVSAAFALKMQAAAGTFTLTGIDTDLTTGNPDLVAETGTFTLTGNAAVLSRALRVAASSGSFSLTGNAAALNKVFTLLAGSGSFTLTGVSNTFKRALVIAASQASFTLTGNAATLTYGSTYDSAASALFARMSTQPNDTRKGHINTCIVALKTAGVWTKIEHLYLLASHDAQSAKLNWKGAVGDLTEPGTSTFTTDSHWTGGDMTLTGVAPNAMSLFTQNDAHLGVWAKTNSNALLVQMTANVSNIVRTSALYTSRENRSANTAVNITMLGHTLWTRRSSTQYEVYFNGVSQVSPAQTSAALTATAPFIRGTNQIAAMHCGSQLSDAEATDLYNALNTYLTAIAP